MNAEIIRPDGMTDNEWYRAHGERLQVARRNLGISEEDAAAAFNVTLRTYRKWEAGGCPRPSVHYLGLRNFVRTYNLPGSFYDWSFGAGGSPPRFRPRLVL